MGKFYIVLCLILLLMTGCTGTGVEPGVGVPPQGDDSLERLAGDDGLERQAGQEPSGVGAGDEYPDWYYEIDDMENLDEAMREYMKSLPPSAFYPDETEWPFEEDFVPLFPKLVDSIAWWSILKGTMMGYGVTVMPNEEVNGFLNIRENPSLDADVVGELYPGDTASVVTERYQTEREMFVGEYRVRKDGYTWFYVEFGEYGSENYGWVASEFVNISAI